MVPLCSFNASTTTPGTDLRNLLEDKRRKTRKRIAQQKQVEDKGQDTLF